MGGSLYSFLPFCFEPDPRWVLAGKSKQIQSPEQYRTDNRQEREVPHCERRTLPSVCSLVHLYLNNTWNR
jgi:hypothetical protein